jgi:hypothetical protein
MGMSAEEPDEEEQRRQQEQQDAMVSRMQELLANAKVWDNSNYDEFLKSDTYSMLRQGQATENSFENTPHVGGSNTLYAIGVGLNASGFVSSAGEYSNVINGSWRGVNGKWNSLDWGGNQWTGARSNALSRAGYFKLASRGFFVVGTGISLYEGGDALMTGNYAGAAKSGLNIGMGAFATFGGPPGWIVGGGYFLLDALGAFDRPTIATPFIQPSFAIPDKTYVAPKTLLLR